MARTSRTLTLEYSAHALNDLDSIWTWNAKEKGISHADEYIAFLRAETLKLLSFPRSGRIVPTHNIYRYKLIKRRNKSHGHLVVFVVRKQVVKVLRYFHTSQNWQNL